MARSTTQASDPTKSGTTEVAAAAKPAKAA
jgi:hypothetical protein